MIKKYRISVTNHTMTTEPAAIAKLTLPLGVKLVNYVAHSGTTFNSATLTWQLLAMPGTSIRHLELHLDVPSAFYGMLSVAVSGFTQEINLQNNTQTIEIHTGVDASCSPSANIPEGCGEPYEHKVANIGNAGLSGNLGQDDCPCWKCKSKYHVVPSSAVNVKTLTIHADTGDYNIEPESMFLPWRFSYEVYCEECAVDCPGATRFGPFGPGVISGNPLLKMSDIGNQIVTDDTIKGKATEADPLKVSLCAPTYVNDTCSGQPLTNIIKRVANKCNQSLGCIAVECQDVTGCVAAQIASLVDPIKSILDEIIAESDSILETTGGLSVSVTNLMTTIITEIEQLFDPIFGQILCAGEGILEYDVVDSCLKINTTNLNAAVAAYLAANSQSINTLSDVDLTIPADVGQTLVWNGTNWVAGVNQIIYLPQVVASGNSDTPVFGPEFQGYIINKIFLERDATTTDNPTVDLNLVQASGNTLVGAIIVSGVLADTMAELTVNLPIPAMGGQPGRLNLDNSNFTFVMFRIIPA